MSDIKNPSVSEKLVLAVCGIGMFVDAYDLFIASMAVPFIKKSFEVNGLLLGLMSGAAPIGCALGAIIVGILADKFGRKKLMYVNMIAFVTVSILSALSWSPLSFIFFRFMVGFWVGADYPICAAYLAEVTQNRRGKSIAMIRLINAFGYPAGALVAFLVIKVDASNDAWRWMLLLGAVPAIIGCLLRTRLPESFVWQASQRVKTSMSGFKTIFNKKYRKNTIIASSCYALKDISEYGIHLFMPMILIALHINESKDPIQSISNAFVLSLFAGLVVVFGALIARMIVSNYDRRSWQTTTFLLSFVSLLTLGFGGFNPFFTSPVVIMSIFVLYNFFITLTGTTTYMIPAEIYDTSVRATGHGFVTSMGKIGAFVGTMFLPFIDQHYGVYITVMLMSVPLLLGALLSALYPRQISNMNLHNSTAKLEPSLAA